MPKGCLKLASPMPSPAVGAMCSHKRKCVAFGAEGSEEIHLADEWDRTPTEPARKLSYQDVLELKEIQRSLPRANQVPDPLSKRPTQPHFLCKVPIGLLPLLPEGCCEEYNDSSTSSSQAPSTPSPSPDPTYVPLFPNGFPSFKPPSPPGPPYAPRRPSHLSHLLPSKPLAPRPRPKFSFLPLLDTPPSSSASSPYTSSPSSPTLSDHHDDHSTDPPTPSLTNASRDSSPQSGAYSPPPLDPPFFQLPPPRKILISPDHVQQAQDHSYFPSHKTHEQPLYDVDQGSIEQALPLTLTALKLEALSSPPLPVPSPLSLSGIGTPSVDDSLVPETNILLEVPPIRRRRQFIVVNDVEIEIEGDEDEDDEITNSNSSSPGASTSQLPELSRPSNAGSSFTSPLAPSLPPLPTEQVPCFKQPQPSSPPLCKPSRNPSSPPAQSPVRIQRMRDLQPPSPVLAPYCVPTRRRNSCSNSSLVQSAI